LPNALNLKRKRNRHQPIPIALTGSILTEPGTGDSNPGSSGVSRMPGRLRLTGELMPRHQDVNPSDLDVGAGGLLYDGA
jgi:hypothetical protein